MHIDDCSVKKLRRHQSIHTGFNLFHRFDTGPGNIRDLTRGHQADATSKRFDDFQFGTGPTSVHFLPPFLGGFRAGLSAGLINGGRPSNDSSLLNSVVMIGPGVGRGLVDAAN